jgi:hypothetical protein
VKSQSSSKPETGGSLKLRGDVLPSFSRRFRQVLDQHAHLGERLERRYCRDDDRQG